MVRLVSGYGAHTDQVLQLAGVILVICEDQAPRLATKPGVAQKAFGSMITTSTGDILDWAGKALISAFTEQVRHRPVLS